MWVVKSTWGTSGVGKTMGGLVQGQDHCLQPPKASPHTLRDPMLFPPLGVPSCLGLSSPAPHQSHTYLWCHVYLLCSLECWSPCPARGRSAGPASPLSHRTPASLTSAPPLAGMLKHLDFSNCATMKLESLVRPGSAPLTLAENWLPPAPG